MQAMVTALKAVKKKFAKYSAGDAFYVVRSETTCLAGTDALFQRWVTTGLVGESLVFCAADLRGARPQAVLQLAALHPQVQDPRQLRLLQQEGFVVVQFNFIHLLGAGAPLSQAVSQR